MADLRDEMASFVSWPSGESIRCFSETGSPAGHLVGHVAHPQEPLAVGQAQRAVLGPLDELLAQ